LRIALREINDIDRQLLERGIERSDHDDLLTTFRRWPATLRPLELAIWLIENASNNPEDMVDIVVAVQPAFKLLDTGKRELVSKSLDVAQSQWVLDDASNMIRHIEIPAAAGGMIAINGKSVYVERFTLERFPLSILGAAGYELIRCDKNTRYVKEVIDQIAASCDLDPEDYDPEELDEEIAAILGRQTVLCLLPGEFAQPAFALPASELQSRFRFILFTCAVGEQFETVDIRGNVERLDPPIDVGEEKRRYRIWHRARLAMNTTL
jgi:hypothetical protein